MDLLFYLSVFISIEKRKEITKKIRNLRIKYVLLKNKLTCLIERKVLEVLVICYEYMQENPQLIATIKTTANHLKLYINKKLLLLRSLLLFYITLHTVSIYFQYYKICKIKALDERRISKVLASISSLSITWKRFLKDTGVAMNYTKKFMYNFLVEASKRHKVIDKPLKPQYKVLNELFFKSSLLEYTATGFVRRFIFEGCKRFGQHERNLVLNAVLSLLGGFANTVTCTKRAVVFGQTQYLPYGLLLHAFNATLSSTIGLTPESVAHIMQFYCYAVRYLYDYKDPSNNIILLTAIVTESICEAYSIATGRLISPILGTDEY